ncbi:MAG: hypothetical protein U0L49_07410 [Eubacterium sp.]|nr:hypothetical protein [Eubacterium sp.]
MNFLNKLERKFGRYAIKHLTLYIITTYVIGYILLVISTHGYPGIISSLFLSPSLILKGQIWRLVSWILMPPTSLNFLTIVMLVFYYQIGTILEQTWGDFLYNLYIFFGLFMTVVGAFLLYLITGIEPFMYELAYSTYYVSLSIPLGFAITYPDMKVMLFFVIPLKMKYMAVIDIVYIFYDVISMFSLGAVFGLPTLVMVICSLAPAILFFFIMRGQRHGTFADRRRRKNFQRQMNMGRNQQNWKKANPFGGQQKGQGPFAGGSRSGPDQTGPGQEKDHHVYGRNSDAAYGNSNENRQAGSIPGGFGYRLPDGRIAKHRCAVCGRTELDDPNLEFRFCSKCNGNYEYCQDHLFTHEHVK